MDLFRRAGRFGLLVSLSIALVLFASLTSLSAQADDEAFRALLKNPGYVELLRHSNALGATPEPNGLNLKD